MEQIYTLLVALPLGANVLGQDPTAITMTTAKAVGSEISFSIGNTPYSNIKVDFGDGSPIEKVIDKFPVVVTGTLKGSKVKIYGSNISLFKCRLHQLTALDISQTTTLRGLDCWDNQLKTLDVSNNTQMTSLECSYNQLAVLDVSQNTKLSDLNCSYNQLTSIYH